MIPLMKHSKPNQTSLKEIAFVFLKLGTTSFGGPAVHIAMMKDEVVSRKKWLSQTEYLDLLGAVNLIPGPNSTEMAIHVGFHQRRWKGLWVAGVSFIFPAMMIVWTVARFYTRYQTLPEVSAILYGIKPVVIAVVFQALISLGRTAIRSKNIAIFGVMALVLAIKGLNEVAILFLVGGASIIYQLSRRTSLISLLSFLFASNTLEAAALSSQVPVTTSKLFLLFLKTGSVLFGSGYVLLAFLKADLVTHFHWLTESQLLDAIAVGQLTPGPVFTTATFIGYLLAGNQGAVAATMGIFLPAFIFVALSAHWIPKLRQSKLASSFLDGVNVASLALMTLTTWELGRNTLVDPISWMIGLSAGFLLIRFRVNSAWLVFAGGLIGYGLQTTASTI